MALDVSTPDPPELVPGQSTAEYDDADVQGDEYRRSELNDALAEGAWADAFQEWANDTSLDGTEWEVVTDLELLREFDFFWDSFAGRVGYHAPGLPEDWRERDLHPLLESWERVSRINASLTELGQVVCDVLVDEYLEWDADSLDVDDLPDF